MNAKTKAGLAVGLPLVALTAGIFLSGYLVQLLLGLHNVPLEPAIQNQDRAANTKAPMWPKSTEFARLMSQRHI